MIIYEWHNFDRLNLTTWNDALRFRQSILVVEQSSPYPDIDDLDPLCHHLLAYHTPLVESGFGTPSRQIIGYLRTCTRRDQTPAFFGRLAVAPDHRGKGLARQLVERALEQIGQADAAAVIEITAQTYLINFYRSFGFDVTSPVYDDFGVPHVVMRRPSIDPTLTSSP